MTESPRPADSKHAVTAEPSVASQRTTPVGAAHRTVMEAGRDHAGADVRPDAKPFARVAPPDFERASKGQAATHAGSDDRSAPADGSSVQGAQDVVSLAGDARGPLRAAGATRDDQAGALRARHPFDQQPDVTFPAPGALPADADRVAAAIAARGMGPVTSEPAREQLSPLDAFFLFFERPTQAFQIGCLAMLEETIPFPDLLEALDERLGSLPRFRQLPERTHFDLGWPTWREDASFDVARHVHHLAVPSPGDEEALADLTQMLLSAPMLADRPRWEVYLIEGLRDGRAALLCKMHHSMSDGISGFRVFQRMCDDGLSSPRRLAGKRREALPDESPQDPAQPVSRPAAKKGFLAGLIDQVRDPKGALRTGARSVLEAVDTLATFADEPPAALPFNGELGVGRRLVWRNYPIAEFESLRMAEGCTINDAVLGIVSGAIRKYLLEHGECPDREAVRAVVPSSIRQGGAEAIGNQVTALFAKLPVTIDDPIERLRAVRREMEQLKSRDQGAATSMLIALGGALPSITEASVVNASMDWKVVNTICTNVPGPREALRMLGKRVSEVHPIAPLFLDVGLGFAVASYAGQLSICAVVDPNLVPDANRIGIYLDEALYETRRALWSRSAALAMATRFSTGPTVGDLMNRDVATVREGDSLHRARDIMRMRHVRHVPVVDHSSRLVGVLRQRDLLVDGRAKSEEPEMDAAAGGRATAAPGTGAAATLAVGAVPDSRHVAVATEPAIAAGQRMVDHELDALPVVDEVGRLVGLFTERHILEWTTDKLRTGARGA